MRWPVFLFALPGLLAACDPSADADVVGDCQGSPVSLDLSSDTDSGPDTPDTGWSWDEVTVTAEVDGGTVVLHLLGFPANCCPSPGADVTVTGSDVRVEFDDVTSDTQCKCSCVQDFDVEVTGLESGDWRIALWYWEELRAELDVTIP
jgi:hypothetical protein